MHIKVKVTIIKPLVMASLLRDKRLKTLRQNPLVAGASIFKFFVLKIMQQFPYFYYQNELLECEAVARRKATKCT
jgi:hypothetical protein